MELLCITDLHDSPAALERILVASGHCDAVLLGGDITNFGSPSDAEKLVRMAQARQKTVLAVAGNCDSAEIEQRLIDLDVSLHGRGLMDGDVGLHGLSAMPPWQATMYQLTEDELSEALQAGYAQIAGAKHHVVLSHCPPRDGRLDRTFTGRHVGSKAVRAFIERTRPDLVICGHIHESRGVDRLGPTTVVNCGPAAAGFYAVAEVGSQIHVELRQA